MEILSFHSKWEDSTSVVAYKTICDKSTVNCIHKLHLICFTVQASWLASYCFYKSRCQYPEKFIIPLIHMFIMSFSNMILRCENTARAVGKAT